MYIILLYTNNKYWQVLLQISTGAGFKTKTAIPFGTAVFFGARGGTASGVPRVSHRPSPLALCLGLGAPSFSTQSTRLCVEPDLSAPSRVTPFTKTKKLSLSTELFVLVREAGLEVAAPNSNNFLELNYVINSSESGILCTIQSIKFMLCKAVKRQNCSQST